MLKLGKRLKAKGIKMDTRQLKYIMEIEKAGSISKAAENLFIGYLKSMVGQI